MTLIRIEPILDEKAGKFLLEIFCPHDAEQPYATTPPRYQSAAAAENDLIAIIASCSHVSVSDVSVSDVSASAKRT